MFSGYGGYAAEVASARDDTELHGTVSELALSRFSATLLLIMYVVFLYFQLVSHTDFFEDEPVEKEDDARFY